MIENTIQSRLKAALEERKSSGNLRQLKIPNVINEDFFSNDYLGLAQNATLQQKILNSFTNTQNTTIGSTGSRLLSGNSQYAIELELYLASIFKTEAALVFNSGFDANAALIAAITKRTDTIYYDSLVHASMREGYLISYAKRKSFAHNNLEQLEKHLKNHTEGEAFILAESIYSMDGDQCNLQGLVELCRKHNAHLILDEAHSTAIIGEKGAGLAVEKNLQDHIFARIHTFGKGPGCQGACVVGSQILIDFLINFARGFIYTTALPLYNLIAIKESFIFQETHFRSLQKKLNDQISLFRGELKKLNLEKIAIPSQSPIQAIKIKGNNECKQIAQSLIKKGFELRPILSPTVPIGEERIRVCLHTYNKDEMIKRLISELDLLLKYTV